MSISFYCCKCYFAIEHLYVFLYECAQILFIYNQQYWYCVRYRFSFYYSHSIIHILLSTFYYPHSIIHIILSTLYYPHSIIHIMPIFSVIMFVNTARRTGIYIQVCQNLCEIVTFVLTNFYLTSNY